MRVLAIAILTCAAATAGERGGDEFSRALGFTLVSQTFADVQQALGPAVIQQTGHDGDAEWHLCYLFPVSRTQVTFKTSDLGGPEHDLLGIELARAPGSTSGTCLTVSSATEASTRLQIGPLRLGMAYRAYKSVLGGARKLPDEGTGRVFLRRQKMTPEEMARSHAPSDQAYWDVQTVVAAEVQHGVIARLEVWRTITN